MERLRISDAGKATTVHGELLILDKNLDKLSQTSIKILLDAVWGKKKIKDGEMHLVELDDTRLFFFNGHIWLYYRNGENLGYRFQAHNPLYIERNSNGELIAFIKASEMVKLCCGRYGEKFSREVLFLSYFLKAEESVLFSVLIPRER